MCVRVYCTYYCINVCCTVVLLNEERTKKISSQWLLLHLVMAIQVSCSAVTQCDDAWAIQWGYTYAPFVYCYLNGYVNCVTYASEIQSALLCKLEVFSVNMHVYVCLYVFRVCVGV